MKSDSEKVDLARLKWIKVVTPPDDWKYRWALSPEAINDQKQTEQVINHNGLTIVPLGFKQKKGAEKLATGDLMALTQRAKLTHIVEIMDERPYEKGGWFHRYVKLSWWKPEINWDNLPPREKVLDCNLQIFQGIPYEFTAFQAFQDVWGRQGGMEAFQSHLADHLD